MNITKDSDPRKIQGKLIKKGDSAIGVFEKRSFIASGPGDCIVAEKNKGISLTGNGIHLQVSPENVNIMGILSINPAGYIPLTPALIMNPPKQALMLKELETLMSDLYNLLALAP